MGRTKYHDTVDQRQQISLSRLRKWGCLKESQSGVITWTTTFRENKVAYDICLYGDSPYMRLHYTSTDHWNGNIAQDYRISLTRSQCQFGGYRWWFLCPYCCQKVATLMDPGKGQYGCRSCLKLCYYSQQRSYHGRIGPLKRMIDIQEKYERLRKAVKRMYYRGKPTKELRRLLEYKAWLDSVAPQLQSQIDQI